MDNTVDRPVSPLYEAIQDMRAGSWPEDEYDVADSPLSYVDFKSQVSVDAIEPVISSPGGAEGTASDTDFESLKSDDESDWDAGADDTMVTDVDTEAHGKRNSDTGTDLLAEIEDDGAVRRSIVEAFGADGPEISGRIDAVVEGEIEPVIRTKAEGDRMVGVGRFRVEATDNTFKSATGGGSGINTKISAPVNAESNIQKGITGGISQHQHQHQHQQPMRLIIPDTPFETPIQELEPPPIPSRSPSRPGTAMANRRPYVETPDIFTVSHAAGSVISLPPARLTVSSLSSPRSSRFFEDLNDQATTTATSVDISSPVPPKRQESGDSTVKVAPRVLQKKPKKKSYSLCGLKFGFGGKKSAKPKRSSSNDNARPASARSSKKE